MSGIPVLKFEKSTNYLNSQLDIQLNNKRLISDIITNIGLILADKDVTEKSSYLYLKNSASNFLKNISENITIIEELKREMKHITSDLSEVIEEINRKEKSKEYYIAAISTIKNNIENYTSKFQYFEQKLNKDNINFNEFINKNNFKYNFISNSDDSYDYSGFSIEHSAVESSGDSEEPTTPKDIKINKLTNEFKNMLSNLSEDTVLSLDLISALKTEFSNQDLKANDFTPTEETESLEEIIENQDTNTNDDNDILTDKNIVIDYSSIYKNYYNKKASTIEESISSEYSSFVPSLDAVAPILPPSDTKKKNNKTPFFILEDDSEEIENKVNEPEVKNKLEDIKPSSIAENDIQIIENNIQEVDSSTTSIEENISEETTTILDEELTEELSNELAKELLENELFGSNNSSYKNTTEEIEITDEDLLNEILKEEISKEPTNIDDIILNDEELTKELLNNSSPVENISILDSISDDDILEQLLISDTTDELLKNFSSDTATPSKEKNTEPLLDYCNIEEKIEVIQSATSNNDTLIISEKQNKVFLPYTIDELQKYLKNYPDIYHSEKDVVEQEFILPFDEILKHQAQSRFFETYNLIKNKEKKSPILAIVYGIKLFCKYNLNPAIIAACKNQKQLDSYLKCLKNNKLNKFKFFKTVYQVNPL